MVAYAHHGFHLLNIAEPTLGYLIKLWNRVFMHGNQIVLAQEHRYLAQHNPPRHPTIFRDSGPRAYVRLRLCYSRVAIDIGSRAFRLMEPNASQAHTIRLLFA